ncbi:hypothetical protein GT755_00020 [Herbidospora sp. NEAU-GS84]|uniref:Uncharacterized protein n=1 Tax=Herbidospora solisilvae TaxID=2696284 RepID=A0A7C9IZR6_9ACTN|nr:hypothetical protein [Herbidospora solisilvae]NAS20067.1 hypothetical protein [Herbidospora solisilvae]
MDVAEVAAQVVPYVTAAIGALGGAVWTKTQDAVVDAAAGSVADGVVGWGRRLLGRVAEREEGRPALESAVADVAADPADQDAVAVLRVRIRKALAADPALAADIQQMLAAAAPITAGPGSQVISGSYIGGDAFQIGSAGSVSIDRRPPSR